MCNLGRECSRSAGRSSTAIASRREAAGSGPKGRGKRSRFAGASKLSNCAVRAASSRLTGNKVVVIPSRISSTLRAWERLRRRRLRACSKPPIQASSSAGSEGRRPPSHGVGVRLDGSTNQSLKASAMARMVTSRSCWPSTSSCCSSASSIPAPGLLLLGSASSTGGRRVKLEGLRKSAPMGRAIPRFIDPLAGVSSAWSCSSDSESSPPRAASSLLRWRLSCLLCSLAI